MADFCPAELMSLHSEHELFTASSEYITAESRAIGGATN